MRAPQVAITTYAEQAAWGPWHRTAALLPTTYVDAIVAAGGVPVLLPPMPPALAADALAGADAVLLAGGADIDPAVYGAAPAEADRPVDPERDAFELAIIRAAVHRDLPLLGVCRGMQLLNVALGGTLIRHLPDHVGHHAHQPGLGAMGTHQVSLDENSRLGRILGVSLDVPTYHHQAPDRLGHGLHPVGWADDGIIEAVELAIRSFVVGVQWHPEEGADLRLFEALITTARGAVAA